MPQQRQRLQMLLPLQMLQMPQQDHSLQMNLMNQLYPKNLRK
jgi:hypothetical protein